MSTLNQYSLSDLSDRQVKVLTRSQAHERMSDKYKPLSTIETIQPFLDAGYKISNVQLGKQRRVYLSDLLNNNIFDLKKQNYSQSVLPDFTGSHIVRLRHDSLKIGNDFLEVVINNSYDGTSKFTISLGVYRLVCANGLILGKSIFSKSLKHIGTDFYKEVTAAIKQVECSVLKTTRAIESIQKTELSLEQAQAYADTIFKQRLRHVSNLESINLKSSLRAERHADDGLSLWQVLNVIQEKIMRGGIYYTHLREIKDNAGNIIELKPSYKKTKRLNNPSEIMRLNQLVFDEAVKLSA